MKNICILLLVIFNSSFSQAQAPVFNWGKSAGGSDEDVIFDIAIPDSATYACTIGCPLTLVGYTKSDDGNLTNCNSLIAGNNQALVLKYNTLGTFLDCFSYGGSGVDRFQKAKYQKTATGFHIVFLGRTSSNDGDVIGNHGVEDAWLVRTNADTIINQTCIGGQGNDVAYDFWEMPDHGFMICGVSNSNIINGDTMNHHGISLDGWIARVDSLGNVLWSKLFGGNNSDVFYSITRTTDGNFVCVGQSNSTDSAFSINHGANDYWVVKIDSIGNLLWQKIYGGSSADNTYKVINLENNNILVSGQTSSFDGDVVGNHSSPGDEDVWILKLDATGDIIWKKCFGGASFEFNRTVLYNNENSIVVTATCSSNDGDLTGIIGNNGTWIFKIDSLGNIIWSRKCGSTWSDAFSYSIASYNSKTFYFVNHPPFSGGNVTVFYGGSRDVWLASITDTSNSTDIDENAIESINVSPNPTKGVVWINLRNDENKDFEIFNSQGSLIKKIRSIKKKSSIDLNDFPNGLYFIKISNSSYSIVKKIIKAN